jgi:hypothetical protein
MAPSQAPWRAGQRGLQLHPGFGMTGYLFRWIIRISLWLIAVLGAALAVIFLWNPSAAWLLVAIGLLSIFGNTIPPPIAKDQLVGMDWRTEKEASERLTALLHQRFPTGSSESALRSMLRSQGFKHPHPPPPRPDCLPPGQAEPIGKTVTHCPIYDRSKVLEYFWGNGVCSQSITVKWSTGDKEMIKGLDARYHMTCL